MGEELRAEPAIAARRNPWVDALRIVSAFGIVWYHSQYPPGRFVAYAGLIVFVVFAANFEARRTRPAPIAETARKLLIPWLFWSLVFAAINLAQHDPLFSEGGLAAGTAQHLWYLPFIFAVACLIRFFRGRVAYPALLGLGVMILTATTWRTATQHAGPPFSQWSHAFPAALFGIVLAQPGRRWTLVAGIAVGAMTLLLSLTGVGEPYAIGCAAAAFALLAETSPRWLDLVQRLTPLMFGVYLVHPIFLAAGHKLRLVAVPEIVFAFVASIGAVLLIRLTRVGRAVT